MRRLALPIGGLGAWIALLAVAPAAALAGWRAAFVLAGAVPVGAMVLLLIARLTGAAWDAALLPLLPAMPWLLPAFVPVVVGQALLPSAGAHPVWLAWPWFGLRGVAAILFWWWLARRLASRRTTRVGSSAALAEWQAGLALVIHGILLTVVGTDWLLGLSPGQPQSAVAMVMTAFQVGAAGAVALALDLGNERVRADLARLMVAALIGAAYLLFVDYLIVWFGDLPARAGWYQVRGQGVAAAVPALAMLLGIVLPVVALPRGWERTGAAGALAGLLCASGWMTAAGAGAPGMLAAIAGALVLGGALHRVIR